MNTLEVSTVVYVPPEEAFEFLVDFPRYARYSEYLEQVEQHGTGEQGTQYDLTFSWWKLSYTARSEVTAVDRPERIDWRLVRHLDASGHWRVTAEPEATADGRPASRVWFSVQFRPGSADEDAIELPSLVSLSWVIDKVKPKIREEAERVIRRVVADLEGEEREVTLDVHSVPGSGDSTN